MQMSCQGQHVLPLRQGTKEHWIMGHEENGSPGWNSGQGAFRMGNGAVTKGNGDRFILQHRDIGPLQGLPNLFFSNPIIVVAQHRKPAQRRLESLQAMGDLIGGNGAELKAVHVISEHQYQMRRKRFGLLHDFLSALQIDGMASQVPVGKNRHTGFLHRPIRGVPNFALNAQRFGIDPACMPKMDSQKRSANQKQQQIEMGCDASGGSFILDWIHGSPGDLFQVGGVKSYRYIMDT